MATRKTSSPAKSVQPAQAKPSTASYQHPDAHALIRPEAGAQTRFKKKKPAATWRYDSSLAPELQWDTQNPAREQGEAHIAVLQAALANVQTALTSMQAQLAGAQPSQPAAELHQLLRECRARLEQLQAEPLRSGREAASALKALSRPFLNWAGKAEHLSFDVPTLPLFIHERLSTQAILNSIAGHKTVKQDDWINDFFGHPERSLPEQLMKAYEHPNGWQNRMVLGDSLVVMNSLLHFESLGGQVQMIYIDPPYGVKFGSNFQPFVRKRDVAHNDDEGFTREPEMVKAYRDTWELGLHSYLTYLRDRLLLARELLTESGSVFVQISDENLHHVREVMDEVFGAENFCSQIVFRKTTGAGSAMLDSTYDLLLWFAKDRKHVKYRAQFLGRTVEDDDNLRSVELHDGSRRPMTPDEATGLIALPDGARPFRPNPITNQRPAQGNDVRAYEFEGKTYKPGAGTFRTDRTGLDRLAERRRLLGVGNTLTFIRYLDDFPYKPTNNIWDDTRQSGFGADKLYVVQTAMAVIRRCMLMTTDPGDLVLDPTCGSGTTAVVAESWGRRWITVDTSRVPLALARQRLLTATFKYHELKEPARGPAGGFVYKEKKNRKGEHIGGIVPHITLGSIANGEPPKYEVLVDRPEELSSITRVCGPFVFEATIPTASNFDGDGLSNAALQDPQQDDAQDFITRMIEVLRSSPVLHLAGGKTVQLAGIRRPAKTLYLSAEALLRADTGLASMTSALEDADAANGGLALQQGEPVALLFGPEHGAIAEVAVLNAWQEATAKNFKHLYVIGFAIEPKARQSISEYSAMGMPTTYVQATPDILMGDLLKNMRSSQIFSVCGQPDVLVAEVPVPEGAVPNLSNALTYYQVKLQGLDVFDPITMAIDTRSGLDVPAWFLDTDYNGMVFRVCQAFFPRTQAWDNLKRALKTEFDDAVWAHLAGDTSTPFAAGTHQQISVKVIDDRGNELMVVKKLEPAK